MTPTIPSSPGRTTLRPAGRFTLALLMIVALVAPAQADTISTNANPNGSRLIRWVQDAAGPAVVTVALKSTRIVAFGVIGSDGEIVCLSVTNGRDRAGTCRFDAIVGEAYAFLAVTGSGSNRVDVTIQSGRAETAFREAPPARALARLTSAAARAQ